MIEPKIGARFTVRDTTLNRGNTYWAVQVGRLGMIVNVGPDDLIDIAMDDGAYVEGVKPERFTIFEAAPVTIPTRRHPWWRRLFRRTPR